MRRSQLPPKHELLNALADTLSAVPSFKAGPLNDRARLELFAAGYYYRMFRGGGDFTQALRFGEIGPRPMESLQGALDALLHANPLLVSDLALDLDGLAQIFTAGYMARFQEES
ncbi:MAG TPA: hypothetical protein VE591_00125 [Candidatus Acidoferrum sp.]|nr:hypothetical protein [Candidatus Acidoferrum sp.]